MPATAAYPARILAVSLGACVPWAAWFAALAGSGTYTVLLFYGPGYKARAGDTPVKDSDVWSKEREGSVVRISRVKAVASLLQESTGARLRAMLLSAHAKEIRLPSLLPASCASPCSETSDSDYNSDRSTTCSSSTASSASAESLTSAANSAPAPPPTATCVALPAPALPTAKSRGTKMISPARNPRWRP
ncbi:hypothetical protein FB451DRAFT_1178765 [Mycena latifolia]|nr:hypothetical protein FB451DRAFT_1178765 [Mycena latifolia]